MRFSSDVMCIAFVVVAAIQIAVIIFRNFFNININRYVMLKDENGDIRMPVEKCPFCGKNVAIVYKVGEDGEDEGYSMVCDLESNGCGCATGIYDTPKDAVLAWNKRYNND